ncbi:MAG: general secretion pathway protein L [Alteromonadaceae bacterium]|mgnify:FL=1|jgi:general secretion pathway protein L|tara:strand:- start:5479 stop:6765 length:1287 start_codon:yes stop_codon:yes gene_type:complete
MAENLYIRIGSQAQDAIHWLIHSASDEEIIASGKLSNASELVQLSEKAQQRQVIVLVPSCDLVLKSLNVPSKSVRAMHQAVPYMLEEELAQDVEQMFFAYGDVSNQDQEASTHQNCFVAAIDRTLMQQWQQWFADANINFKKMLPDALAMPLVNDGCSAIVLDQQVILRQGPWQAMTIDSQAWAVISSQLINTADDKNKELADTNEGSPFLINAYSTLPSGANELNIKAMPEELPLALLAQQAIIQPFNLLQGEFQYHEKRSPVVANWLWAAGIAIFALLFNVGLKGGQLLQVNSQLESVEQEIVNSYKATFPNTKNVRVNTIKSQLKRKLTQVGDGNSQTGFLVMLGKIRPAFEAVPELKPESLKFDGKRQEIRLQAIANDYQYFDKFKIEIEKNQLSVKKGAQSNQDDQVSGSFSISEPSSIRGKS